MLLEQMVLNGRRSNNKTTAVTRHATATKATEAAATKTQAKKRPFAATLQCKNNGCGQPKVKQTN
jgi:hypothetical protein